VATDPRECRFDPSTMLCQQGETSECLTEAQIGTLRKLYQGPRDPRTGAQIIAGFAPTMEAAQSSTSWHGMVASITPERDRMVSEFFGSLVFDDPHWGWRQFDFSKDIARSRQRTIAGETLDQIFHATASDLSKVRDRGSKIIVYEGWGDLAVAPEEVISLYDSVTEQMGPRTPDFYRLFMVPGMTHCGKGPGANAFGQSFWGRALPVKNDADHHISRALEAWVERGIAPDKIIATKYVDENPAKGTQITRPICPYPEIPQYTGTGSTAVSTSFVCAAPPARGIAARR
jgi:feruloyl esterase